MPTIKKSREDKEAVSAIISDRVRTISLAILGLCWVFIVANLTSNTSDGANLTDTKYLLIPAFFSILTLFLDFVQYILGFRTISKTVDTLFANLSTDKNLDQDTYSLSYGDINTDIYTTHEKAFWSKIIAMSFAVISFFVIILLIIFG
jgi:hypothetical protein